MAYYLSPIGNAQIIDANGDPMVGGTISTFLAGTSTTATTYTDDTGGTSQGVVMTLNSLGYPENGPVWMLGGVPLKFIIKNASGVTQSTFDDISGIGDTATTQDEWTLYGAAPTYISATSFSVVGDQTNTFQVLRKLKSTNSGGTTFSTIATSAFAAGVTTVTVTNTSGTLDSGMSAVSYGLLSATNPSVPESATGKLLRVAADAAAGRTALSAMPTACMIVQDQKASGTAGGGSSAGTNTRVLNTTSVNTITGASLASNQITLPAGTFDIDAFAPCYLGDYHKLSLYNVTDTATSIIGNQLLATSVVENTAQLTGRITIAGAKVFELRHYIQTAKATNGLGNAATMGLVEVYASVRVSQVA